MNCHQDSETGTGVHWMALTKAHYSLQDNRRAATADSLVNGTRMCLSCHDGVSAPDAGHSSMQMGSDYSDRSRNHPVGVRYPFSGKTRAEVPLRAASSVPPTVNLAGGMVSCLSCHNLYASDSQRLSVPIEGSQLCFACHDMN